MFRSVLGRVGALAWVLVLMAGCGQSSASVEGEVTYDGQPIENGRIAFLPADGKGPEAGGDIRNGHYTVADLPPGPKVVQVEAVKAVSFARTSDEAARLATNKARGNTSGIIDPADIIPPNVEGNNQTVQIKAGKQTLNLHLKKPSAKRS